MIARLAIVLVGAAALVLALRAFDVGWPWDALVIIPFAVLAGRFVIPRPY